ncbi:hypothetical protein BD626DRAFT_431710 [Schizophyllum amplum]|uniref:DNA polymerase beta n=1 Tax=Schizophyllum amplum TaxID=97359 RepID=A0A550CE88_9AGAR|nr:hypothetical protein BD626DRAFT_431710 [Auriculariopsis ampla]
MALEERIASHRTSGSLSSKTMKRPTDKASKEKTDDVVKSGATTKTSKQRGESSRKAAASIQPKPEPKIEPTTYAQYVKQARKEQSQSAATTQNLFAGMIIYLLIADDDMEDVRCKVDCLIVHGAKVLLYYRPEACTHIITAEPSLDPSLLVRMRIDSVDEIPKHIKIFNWNFVVSVLNNLIAAESQIYAKKAAQGRNYNVADEILPENRPPGYFIPPQELWPEYFACPEREGSPKLGIDVHQRNSQTADMIDSKEATASPPHAAAASPSLSPDAPNPGSASDANGVPTPGSSSDTPEKPASTNIDPSDPLAEFYEQAKKDRVKENAPAAPNAQLLNDIANWWDLKQDVGKEGKEEKEGAWWDRAEETEDEDGVEDSPVKKGKKKRGKRGFTCDIKPAPGARGPCPNQDVVDTLTELMGLHKVKPGDDHHWRAFSYQKSLKAIRDYPHRIRSVKEAKKIPGVGEKTADKIMEIIHTGNLRRLHHEHTEDVDVLRLFQGIYGVGQATAVNWYAWGCRTLEDIKEGKHGVKLTTCQKIGLKYYDDLQLRMPREEVQALFDVIVPYARRIDPKLELRAMGSFRRGKKDCGDIDIMITRPTDDGETHAGALRELLLKLHRADILTEDLAVPDDLDDPECVYHGLCHLPKTPGAKQRRIDFLAVPWKSRGAALIYYTGDDIFNRAMRYKAGSMGYSLNQKGLYAGVVRDVHDRRIKTNRGNIIASETEEEIFKILGVPWQEPCERVRNH